MNNDLRLHLCQHLRPLIQMSKFDFRWHIESYLRNRFCLLSVNEPQVYAISFPSLVPMIPAAKALVSLRMNSNFKKYFWGMPDFPDIYGRLAFRCSVNNGEV